MYCPKCSQQQISEEMRFCSRCGFPLGGVRELIVSGAGTSVNPYYRPFRGMRQGLWWMLAGIPLSFFIALLTAVDDDFAVFFIVPLLIFIVAFIRMVYSGFIQGRKARAKSEAISSLTSGMPAPAELPPARAVPASNLTQPRVQTSEIIQPPSVTENTTRLLDEEARAHREN